MESNSMSGVLHVVATPIGNLGDVSARMADVLAGCDWVACEDKRVSVRIMHHLGIEKPFFNYRDDNEQWAADSLLGQLQQGKNIALVSDAGIPAISDPGFRITRLCHRNGIRVIPIPGPNAALSALSASGLPSNAFLFLGFLPPKHAARVKVFKEYATFPHSLILYESPHRILKCLDDLLEVIGSERYICVAKELTKMHEAILTGTLGVVRQTVMQRSLKGEFVMIVAPEGFVL